MLKEKCEHVVLFASMSVLIGIYTVQRFNGLLLQPVLFTYRWLCININRLNTLFFIPSFAFRLRIPFMFMQM